MLTLCRPSEEDRARQRGRKPNNQRAPPKGRAVRYDANERTADHFNSGIDGEQVGRAALGRFVSDAQPLLEHIR